MTHMHRDTQPSGESKDLRPDEQVYEREMNSYEPPRLEVIGRFEELTLGEFGSQADGFSASLRK